MTVGLAGCGCCRSVRTAAAKDTKALKKIEDVREAHASPCVQLSGNTGLARKNSHAAKNRFAKFGQMVSGGDGGPDGLANIFNRNGT